MTPTAVTRAAREPVDVRLAAGAVTGWLAVLWGTHRGAREMLVVAAAAGLGGAVLLARRAPAAVALGLFCVALVLVPLAGRVAHADAGALHQLAAHEARVVTEATVRTDPAVLAAKGVAGAPRVVVQVEPLSLTYAGRRVAVGGSMLVIADESGWTGVLPGQRVRIDGSLAPDLGGDALSVTLFARTPPELLGHPPWWQRLAGHVRSSLVSASAVLPSAERGLLPGLIDGDTSQLDPVLAERFRLAGLTHLVAVSGARARQALF